jgi:hypothetical protein
MKTFLRKACENEQGFYDVVVGNNVAHKLIGASQSTIAAYIRKGYLKRVGTGLLITKSGIDAA